MIRKIWIIALLLTATLGVKAQEQLPPVIKGGCTPELEADADDGVAAARAARRLLPAVKTNWDPDKTYRQAVILVEFQNMAFRAEHPRETYDSIFNYPGYNGGVGPGCVAEYFQEQSGGLFNPQFDVFGPYKVPGKARLNEKATKDTKEYGAYQMAQAVEMWVNEDKARDHSVYDWDGNRSIDQVIFVFAGYAGNAGVDSLYGYLWPHTGEKFAVSSVVTYDDYTIAQCSASCEMRTSKTSWGFGTICHEYTHALGLPDLYPTSSNGGFSVVDEWDLMDGGNYTNNGQCPPCLSGMERMLLGWQTPIELTEPTTITDMKPLSEGGPVYMVRHTDKEYYLLENRQWTGWDAGLPGKGLLVVHVDYDAGSWSANSVNTSRSHRRYQFVAADNRDYDDWEERLLKMVADSLITSQYRYPKRMNNLFMSETPYPWAPEDSVGTYNDLLTDTSTPKSEMFNKNSAGSKFLSKSITNIRVSEDGLVSFDFMGGETKVADFSLATEVVPTHVYDLRGCCVGNRLESQRPGIYIIRYSDGSTRKVVKK